MLWSDPEEEDMTFLHGRLKVHVRCAEGLPDTDTFFFNIDADDFTDPYVTGDLGPARLFKTRYIANELNPVWDETFNVYVCHQANSLVIKVMDKEHVGSAFVASTSIRAEDLAVGDVIDGWFDLTSSGQNVGRISLAIQYVPKEALEEELTENVPDAYFPLRENNRLTLYQNADTPQLPQFDGLTCPDGTAYETTHLWKDLYEVLKNAQKFIYITGWSVYTGISLVRDEGEDVKAASNVGELLKTKADEGVKVVLMIWNEMLSSDSCPGLMGTHDNETTQYFHGTNVLCFMVPRHKTGVLANSFVSTCYTHHQKTIIADVEDTESGLRRVVAFIGGIDITDGRYDTPDFPLFNTLNTLHDGDFYNNCITGVTKESGPRQPWHDCHAKVEGPAALDIKKNFDERFSKQQQEEAATCLYHLTEDEFVADDIPAEEDNGGFWSVQLFRSITSDSCIFDMDLHNTLHKKEGKLVENTIAKSMIQQIRNAKNFIYMENQYFLGSAYSWKEDKKTLTHHLVPREITQRICDSIGAGQMFRCYILIPMFPEGDPASAAIQEILFWQYRTMQSMYRRIAKAIKDSENSDVHSTDYLSFFCLGKRESTEDLPEDVELATPEPGSSSEVVRNSLRHPVYVHSKMTVIDDSYVLVGSANVNQRSLGGNRDSEIAIGAFQPEHTVLQEGDPRGGVHTYRMALWSAHFGGYDEAFLNPNSDECMDKVREVSLANWDNYTADEPQHSDIHILPYPIQVDDEGEITPLSAPWDCFPDTSAPVLGSKSGYLPVKLTT